MIPTTFGSGSEVTKISVLKVDGVKKSFHDERIIPDIAMVDGHTKRNELEEKVNLSAYDLLLNATNPAGQITPSLIGSIENALVNEIPTCIEVDGEGVG